MALSVRRIDPSFNDEMLRILLESPMESDGLTLVLDRTPDIFTVPAKFFRDYQAYGFFMDDALVGFGMICEKELYINGKPRLTGYFANLYVKREARKLGWLYRASAPFFDEIQQKTPIGYAVTVKGNKASEAMIGRRVSKFPFMPHTVSIEHLYIHNILVTFKKRGRRKYLIRKATDKDLPEISTLLDNEYKNRLFGPVMTMDNLQTLIEARPNFSVSNYYLAEKDGKTVGVCSAWDIASIRQTRVLAYRKMYRVIYTLYHILQPLFGFPRLPRPGEPFRELVLNDFATENRNPEILEELIISIYNDHRKLGYNLIQIGSYQKDPMLNAAKKFFTQPLISHIVVGTSTHDLIEKEQIDVKHPFVDIALT